SLSSVVRPSFFTHPATPEIYTLSLHDALPISLQDRQHPGQELLQIVPLRPRPHVCGGRRNRLPAHVRRDGFGSDEPGRRLLRLRSEEHTSELQSRENLVCRLLLEKKKD